MLNDVLMITPCSKAHSKQQGKMHKISQQGLLLAATLMASVVSAQAVLPMPEPEMDNPSNAVNSALMQAANANTAQTAAATTGTRGLSAAAQIMNNDPLRTIAGTAQGASSAQAANQIASPASASPIQTKTIAALVSTDAQGVQSLQAITATSRLQKGDTIEYRTYVTNASADRVKDLTVTVSLPTEVELLGDIYPSTAFASIDGKNFSRMPLRGKIDGAMQVIPLKYYKALRWTLEDIDLNQTAMAKYQVKVR